MGQYAQVLLVLPRLPILLVHLAGVVAAIVLLVRRRGTPAILSLVGFGLLFIMDLVSFAGPWLINLLVRQGMTHQLMFANAGMSCCCNTIDMLALVCLIVAIWQAVSVGASEG